MSDWKRNRLRVLRAERRLTQNDVAQKLGISQAAYWQLETGLREPKSKTKKRLARILHVPEPELLEKAS